MKLFVLSFFILEYDMLLYGDDCFSTPLVFLFYMCSTIYLILLIWSSYMEEGGKKTEFFKESEQECVLMLEMWNWFIVVILKNWNDGICTEKQNV
jgi:hypothetical protein